MPPNSTENNINISYTHIINNLQNYMMSAKLYNRYNTKEKPPIKKQIINKKINSQHIFIKDSDQLFWYFFIAKYGYDEYQYLDHKFVKEKQLKIHNIELMKKNNSILKQHKIKLCDYETNLLNSKNISLTTLKGLCAYNQVNLIYINNKTYYDFNFNDTQIPIIIHKSGKTYTCEINSTLANIETIKQTYYYIDNPNKPIKGISTYKIENLRDICKKLDICINLESGTRKNKKVLYEEIKAYL